MTASKKSEIGFLIQADRFKEWIEKGGYFGIIRKKNCFVYSTLRGNIAFHSIQDEYILGAIPVFDYIDNIDTSVKQGRFLICEKTSSLETAGIYTCAGLSLDMDDLKFLAHIDALTNIQPMISAIKSNVLSAVIYKGLHPLSDAQTVPKCMKICNHFGIEPTIITVSFMDTIKI